MGFSAEYGVKSNAQVIMVTKSGTNYLHGTAYDFVQNDRFNARDYFDQTGKPSPNKQNIYGITAGGPIIKNRTFVFAGYEGRKTRGGSFTTLANVPSALARTPTSTNQIDPGILDLMNRFLPAATGPDPKGNLGNQSRTRSPLGIHHMTTKKTATSIPPSSR